MRASESCGSRQMTQSYQTALFRHKGSEKNFSKGAPNNKRANSDGAKHGVLDGHRVSPEDSLGFQHESGSEGVRADEKAG